MKALLDYVSTVTDSRQQKKLRHKMMDIIMRTTGWKSKCLGKNMRIFCAIIWNFPKGFLRMIRSREYLLWYPLNFWKISRKDGMNC